MLYERWYEKMGEREKSALYPAVTISDCIEFIETVDSFKSRTVAYRAVADKYGLSSITTKSFTKKVGSAKQYGLITTSNSTIQLTDLAKKILYPVDNNVQDLRRECFLLPPLYAALIEEYDGKAIPSVNLLANQLMNKHKISKVAKDVAARVFIQNADDLGLISAGVLSVADRVTNEARDSADKANNALYDAADDNEQPLDKAVNTDDRERKESNDYITQSIPIDSGKIAKIIIPVDSTEDDLLMIRDMLDVILKRKFKIEL